VREKMLEGDGANTERRRGRCSRLLACSRSKTVQALCAAGSDSGGGIGRTERERQAAGERAAEMKGGDGDVLKDARALQRQRTT
jgi:hypothetical protein